MKKASLILMTVMLYACGPQVAPANAVLIEYGRDQQGYTYQLLSIKKHEYIVYDHKGIVHAESCDCLTKHAGQ